MRFRLHGDPNIVVRHHNRNAKCAVDDCLKSARSKGLCSKHYDRFRKYGDPLQFKAQVSGETVQKVLALMSANPNMKQTEIAVLVNRSRERVSQIIRKRRERSLPHAL